MNQRVTCGIYIIMFEIKGTDVQIAITAKPNSHKFKILIDENRVIICLKSRPEGNKANIELVKELERLTKKRVSIVSGEKLKKKKLLVHNATESEIRSAFERS